MSHYYKGTLARNLLFISLFITSSVLYYSCSESAANQQAPPPLAVPVITITSQAANTYHEYPASLEGKVNVEIRPQVDGYLDQILVDEGAYVKAGQPLFKINNRPYQEAVSSSNAGVMAAKANLQKAQVEIDRLSPLVENKVISDIQMKAAKAVYAAAEAALSQAQAGVSNARINLGYTIISAPVSGYIGKIPYKAGSLVGRGELQPLTVLSDVHEMYAYFSLSETDFIHFKEQYPGKTMEEKIKNLPPAVLVLADNTLHPQEGSVNMVNGQFDKYTGAISLRAVFPNANGLLRSGNTGKIRLSREFANVIVVPQSATVEIQDKVFVFAVGDSNKVSRQPITIMGKSGTDYLVQDGIKAGDRIVFTGLDHLQEGAVIQPQKK